MNQSSNNIFLSASKNGIIFDPSSLYYLGDEAILRDNIDESIKIFIPDTLFKLVELSRNNLDNKEFLFKFLVSFSNKSINKARESFCFDKFYKNYESCVINPIYYEKDKEYQEVVKLIDTKNTTFNIKLDNTDVVTNLYTDIVVKTLLISKKNNLNILSKTRKFANVLKEKITSFELSISFEKILKLKKKLLVIYLKLKKMKNFMLD